MGGALARHTVANGLRLAARSARAARALAASRLQALVCWFTPPARIADGVCDNTGAGRAKREAAITGSRAYGLMLPPGLFQPSHSSTLDNAGCLAMYPPVRVSMRVTGLAREGSAGA
jgi:hypothetical protein